jgi:peptide/nickel transport system ATP-binding protein
MNIEAPVRADPRLLLQVEDLSFRPAHRVEPALQGISLALKEREILTVLGRHVSGRDMLRDILLGIWPRGELSGTLRRRTPLTYLPGPDHAPFVRHARVSEQMVRIVAQRMQSSAREATDELQAVLSRLPGAPQLEGFSQKAGELSPGEIGVAALAIALAQRPSVLLADDPVASLDAVEAETLLDWLLQARAQQGFALLAFTGNAVTAMELGGRVLVLRDGRVIEQGPVRQLADNATEPFTQALFRSTLTLKPPGAAIPAARGEPLLEVRKFALRAARDSHPAGRLSFELRKGASLALVGMHGSGRRDLARAILGLDRAPKGRIIFDAVDVGVLAPHLRARLKQRIAYMAGDDAVLDPRMTVLETVMEPMQGRIRVGGQQIRHAAELLLKRVGLGEVPQQRLTSELAPVQRRRLQIARLLAAAPQLAVLYEPLAGLGALGQSVILALLRELRREEGVSLFLVTGDFAVAQALAEQAIVLCDGLVVESGPVSELIRSPGHAYTRVLVDAAARRSGMDAGPASAPADQALETPATERDFPG